MYLPMHIRHDLHILETRIIRAVRQFFEELREELDDDAVFATLKLGGKGTMFTKVTFSEFLADGVTKVKASGPIAFTSDNPAVTIDNTQQTLNADGLSIDCPIVEVPQATPQAVNLAASDAASVNKVAAAVVDNVSPLVQVATKATLTLN
jgi:hypothetical protein